MMENQYIMEEITTIKPLNNNKMKLIPLEKAIELIEWFITNGASPELAKIFANKVVDEIIGTIDDQCTDHAYYYFIDVKIEIDKYKKEMENESLRLTEPVNEYVQKLSELHNISKSDVVNSILLGHGFNPLSNSEKIS